MSKEKCPNSLFSAFSGSLVIGDSKLYILSGSKQNKSPLSDILSTATKRLLEKIIDRLIANKK